MHKFSKIGSAEGFTNSSKNNIFYCFFLAEVKLAVSSHIKYSLQAYWAVSIRELHMSLWRPWTEIREAAVSQVGSIVDPSHCQQLAFDLR